MQYMAKGISKDLWNITFQISNGGIKTSAKFILVSTLQNILYQFVTSSRMLKIIISMYTYFQRASFQNYELFGKCS